MSAVPIPLDAFSFLGLPRQLSLDEEAIRSAYFAQAKHLGDGPDSAQLHAAFEALLAPEKRLRHFLDLAAPEQAKQWRTVPMSESLMRHFTTLAQLRPQAEAIIERRAKAASALAKALLEKEVFALRDDLETIGTALDEQRSVLLAQLPALDQALAQAPDSTWPTIAAAQAHFSYLAKWQSQVRELLLKLM